MADDLVTNLPGPLGQVAAPPAAGPSSSNQVSAYDEIPFYASKLHDDPLAPDLDDGPTIPASALVAGGQRAWAMAEGGGKPPVLQMPEMLITGSPSGADLPELARNAQGPDVAKLQRALSEAGFGVPAIGKFGPKTEAAVLAFQKAHQLEETGVVDSDTWQALRGAAPRACSTR